MNNVNIRHDNWDHLFNITFVFLLLAPQNNILYFGVPILIALISKEYRTDPSFIPIVSISLITVGISAIINIIEPWFSTKAILKATEFLVLLFCFGRTRRVHFIKGYLVFTLLYLFFFQICDFADISFITRLKTIIYPLSEESMDDYAFYSTFTLSDVGSYGQRLGSIFYNSNNYASALQFLLAVFIIERNQFQRKWFFAFLAIFAFSFLLAGSRTSFVILIAMFILFIATTEGAERKTAITLCVCFVAAVLIYGSNMRMFMVGKGMNDSFGAKVQILQTYLQNLDAPLKLLFGAFNSMATTYYTNYGFAGCDFDIGNTIICYGFTFLFFILAFLIRFFKTLQRQYLIIFCPLIWCFSNTIIMNYRMSAVFFLLASVYCIRSTESVTVEDYYID